MRTTTTEDNLHLPSDLQHASVHVVYTRYGGGTVGIWLLFDSGKWKRLATFSVGKLVHAPEAECIAEAAAEAVRVMLASTVGIQRQFKMS